MYVIGIYGYRRKSQLDSLFGKWMDIASICYENGWSENFSMSCVLWCCVKVSYGSHISDPLFFGQWALITKSLYIESLFGIYVVPMNGEWEKKVTANTILPEIKDDADANSTIGFILPLQCYLCNALLARIFITTKKRSIPLSLCSAFMCLFVNGDVLTAHGTII